MRRLISVDNSAAIGYPIDPHSSHPNRYTDLNERPNGEYRAAPLPTRVTNIRGADPFPRMDLHMQNVVFDTVLYEHRVWQHEVVHRGESHGYYHIFRSWFHVPQGIPLPGEERHQPPPRTAHHLDPDFWNPAAGMNRNEVSEILHRLVPDEPPRTESPTLVVDDNLFELE